MSANSAPNGVALKVARTAMAVALALSTGFASAAATIVINNINAPGVGFNDPTPAAPVGGNPGVTLGQQRLNAFAFAANIWGATLTSAVPIVINAQFSALACNATGATLGSAGATQIFRDFTGATKAATWYSVALANKIFGSDLSPGTADINANFNVNLGNPGCLTGTFWYFGFDNNHGSNIDFVTVLLHEMGHGIGFQTFTSGSTGAQNGGFPSIWDWYLLNNATNKLWKDMTNAERQASAISVNQLVWSGPVVTGLVPSVIGGLPDLEVSAPASVAGDYQVGTASFGPPLTNLGVTGRVMSLTGAAGSNQLLACEPLNAVNAAAVNGKIALIDRGICGFVVKVKNAQNAGAVGVVIADNVAGSPPPGLGGSDPTITIPAVRITLADGNKLKTALATRSRTTSAVVANIGLNQALGLAGADSSNRMLMYAPNPFIGGSSVSHYDVSALPNMLMEPNINADLTHSVIPPQDLTFPLLQDIGW
jgi:hypothetical protein